MERVFHFTQPILVITCFCFCCFVNSALAIEGSTHVSPDANKQENTTYYDMTNFRLGEKNLSQSEKVGREIWYKATAGNDRFHTYVFQQRVGVLIDWFRVLRSDAREDRFKAWGLMNDPDCCTPGSEGCPAKSLEETYGFDWCPGITSFCPMSANKDTVIPPVT